MFFRRNLSTFRCDFLFPALLLRFPPLSPRFLPSDLAVNAASGVAREARSPSLLRRSCLFLFLQIIVWFASCGEIHCHPGRAPYQGGGRGCPGQGYPGVHSPGAAPHARQTRPLVTDSPAAIQPLSTKQHLRLGDFCSQGCLLSVITRISSCPSMFCLFYSPGLAALGQRLYCAFNSHDGPVIGHLGYFTCHEWRRFGSVRATWPPAPSC